VAVAPGRNEAGRRPKAADKAAPHLGRRLSDAREQRLKLLGRAAAAAARARQGRHGRAAADAAAAVVAAAALSAVAAGAPAAAGARAAAAFRAGAAALATEIAGLGGEAACGALEKL
jgi:hypothetical protein